MSARIELSWRRLAGVVLNALALGALLGLAAFPDARRQLFEHWAPAGQRIAQVGGPFELTSQDGQRVTDRTFRGRPMVVAFGYAGDPDLTPAILQMLAAALSRLGPAADQIAVLFITLEPDRDTPAVLKSHLAHYDRRLIGLTGTQAEIAAVAKAYRLPLAHSIDAASATSATIAFEPLFFLMNRRGEYVTHLSHESGLESLIQAIKDVL